MGKKYSREDELTIISLYQDGILPEEIAFRFNTYNTTIRRILLRNDIPLISIAERHKVVKDNPFEDLSNKEVQYWLGYLAADGCVSDRNNWIDVSTVNDPDHLLKYIAFVGYPLKLRAYSNKRYGNSQYSVRFSNGDVHRYLCELGITLRKSLTIKINFDLTWDFVRGVIDGDGYIKYNTDSNIDITIATGSEAFRDQLMQFFKSNGIQSYSHLNNNIYIVGIYKYTYIEKVFNAMYYDGCICLDRKRDKFGSLARKPAR